MCSRIPGRAVLLLADAIWRTNPCGHQRPIYDVLGTGVVHSAGLSVRLGKVLHSGSP